MLCTISRYIIGLLGHAYVSIHTDAVAGISKALYRYSCRENEENDETPHLLWPVACPAKIQNWYFRNICLELYHYTRD
jgi:hypothetical protein